MGNFCFCIVSTELHWRKCGSRKCLFVFTCLMENKGLHNKSELVFSIVIIADSIPDFSPTIVKKTIVKKTLLQSTDTLFQTNIKNNKINTAKNTECGFHR